MNVALPDMPPRPMAHSTTCLYALVSVYTRPTVASAYSLGTVSYVDTHALFTSAVHSYTHHLTAYLSQFTVHFIVPPEG